MLVAIYKNERKIASHDIISAISVASAIIRAKAIADEKGVEYDMFSIIDNQKHTARFYTPAGKRI